MPDSNPRRKSALLGALLPIVIILITAGLYWFLSESNKGGDQSVDSDQSIKLKGSLVSGQTYYIFASEVEVYPTNSENEPWDFNECWDEKPGAIKVRDKEYGDTIWIDGVKPKNAKLAQELISRAREKCGLKQISLIG